MIIMQTVTLDEIMDLYRQCGLSEVFSANIRTDINKGTLGNKLNCDFSFLYKGRVSPINNTVGTTEIDVCGNYVRSEADGLAKQESRDQSREKFEDQE